MDITITKSKNKDKKFDAIINGKKRISFGQAGASDFTKHKDEDRKQRYIDRHSNEDHTKKNIASPAYMSRWITWNKPTIEASISDLNKKYKDVKFKYKSSYG